MKNKNKLPLTEELDFHYLLALMPPLCNIPEFAWLPELFSIIGYESLVELCYRAGGETITLPTIEQLSNAIESLQCFYDVYIAKRIRPSDIPKNLAESVRKICDVYASNREGLHQEGST